MLAIKKARKLIESKPTDEASVTLADLVLALETEQSYPLHRLYDLDYKRFELAMEILAEWRLDRYYASKLKLIDASNQIRGLAAAATSQMQPAQPSGSAVNPADAPAAAEKSALVPTDETQMPGI